MLKPDKFVRHRNVHVYNNDYVYIDDHENTYEYGG
jgi:hypothetical protein